MTVKQEPPKKESNNMRLLTELGPLLAFFAMYEYYGMIIATVAIMILSIITLFISYYFHKRIPFVNLFITIIIVVLGSITLLTGNSTFIKIKPTVINIIFASTLLGGLYFKKLFLKKILGDSIILSDKEWTFLSKRFAYFFIFLATFNEIIWRNFSDDVWVKFKVFGIIIFTCIFIAFHKEYLYKTKED